MKRFTVLILILFLSVLSGCTLNDEGNSLVLVYNGEIYDYNNWSSWELNTNTDFQWEESIAWTGSENDINNFNEVVPNSKAKVIKEDINHLIVMIQSIEEMYFLKRDALYSLEPRYISKVTVSSETSNMTFEDKDLLRWMELSNDENSKSTLSKKEESSYHSIGQVYYYFYDLPIHYNYGELFYDDETNTAYLNVYTYGSNSEKKIFIPKDFLTDVN